MSEVLRGIFDRNTVGRSTDRVELEVERGRIRFFSQVLGERDPIHSDIDAANAMGFPDLVAPPSFFMVIEALAEEASARVGQPSAKQLIGCDFRYLLHGDETYVYRGPVFAGDQLSFVTTVDGFYEKRGGALEFATLSSVVSHAERGDLIRATRTLIHRLG